MTARGSREPREPDGGIVIRRAGPDDGGLLLELIRELAEYERLADSVEADAGMLRASLAADPPVAHALIAQRSGEPAGFALWFYSYSTFLARSGIYLEDLYVRPAHRGRGVGRALLASLARRAVAERCGRLEWSVLDWNTGAIDFYRSLGAERVAGWTVQRLEGAALEKLARSPPAADGRR